MQVLVPSCRNQLFSAVVEEYLNQQQDLSKYLEKEKCFVKIGLKVLEGSSGKHCVKKRKIGRETISALTQIYFFDLEEGVLRAVADVGCRNHINASTNTSIVDGRNHRFVALKTKQGKLHLNCIHQII